MHIFIEWLQAYLVVFTLVFEDDQSELIAVALDLSILDLSLGPTHLLGRAMQKNILQKMLFPRFLC